MRKIKFITTFSERGYNVYGKQWIETFLKSTASRDNITAKIYINGMDLSQFNFGNKIEVVDYDIAIPQYNEWVKLYNQHTIHTSWVRSFAFRFGYKAFVMMDALKSHNDEYIVWLDADCIFKSDEHWVDFPEKILNGAFVACQFESQKRHVESGMVAYDSRHPDKQKYVDTFESYYMTPAKFNSFPEFFDGFVVYESINNTGVSCVNLNAGYNDDGIVVADPNETFLNPELNKRFLHNIGYIAKKNYNVGDTVLQKLVYEVDSIPSNITYIAEDRLKLTAEEKKLAEVAYVDALIKFIKENNIKTVLDYGCGDWSYSNNIDWSTLVDSYIGVDINYDVIKSNNSKYSSKSVKFKSVNEFFVFPEVDLIICKDVLQHLPNIAVKHLLTDFKLNSKFSIITNDIFHLGDVDQNDCTIGGWRTINLQSFPWYENGEVLLEWQVQDYTKQTFVIGSQPADYVIPKIILQTSRTPYAPYVEKMWQERTDRTWKRLWFDDETAIKFFKNNPLLEFPNIIEVFNSFTYGPHKADLFRYYFMYINGGYFIDSDVMTHIRMDTLCPTTYDHLMVISELEVNYIHNPQLNNRPVIFNGLMGCAPKSKIMYDALVHAYYSDPATLANFVLCLVAELYNIVENNKEKYNIFFYEERTEDDAWFKSHIVNNTNKKIASHFYSNKTISEDCRLYYWANARYKNYDFKFHIHHPAKDLTVSKFINQDGCWKQKISEIIINSLSKSGIFVDIGANIGWYTKLAQLHGNEVIAIESQLENFILLEKNCIKDRTALYNLILDDVRIDDILSPEIAKKTSVVKIDAQATKTNIMNIGAKFFDSLSKGTTLLIQVDPCNSQFDMPVFKNLIDKASSAYAISYFKDQYNTQMTIDEAVHICLAPQEYLNDNPGAYIPESKLEFYAVITI